MDKSLQLFLGYNFFFHSMGFHLTFNIYYSKTQEANMGILPVAKYTSFLPTHLCWLCGPTGLSLT